MSPDPTPLEMIYDQLTRIEKKQDITNTCLVELKIKVAKHEERLSEAEKDLNHQTLCFKEHTGDKETHFNPHHSESFGEKIRRKKGEITVAAGGGTLVSSLIIVILKVMEVI